MAVFGYNDQCLSEILVQDALTEGMAFLAEMSETLWEARANNRYLCKEVDLEVLVGIMKVSMDQLITMAETYVRDVPDERRRFLQNDIENMKKTYEGLMKGYKAMLEKE